MIARLFTIVGLVLDIIGALLLLKFGLPAKIDPEGHCYLITEQVDENEIALGKIYKRWSNFAIILIVLGFCGQLIGVLI